LMEAGETDPEELARQALTWVHEQSRKGTAMAAEHEPLTAEDTLERIKMLLDNGEREALRKRDEEIAELRKQSETLRERVEELESFVELADALRRRETT
jgi:arsenate reductase-like glutaredoxin family protein